MAENYYELLYMIRMKSTEALEELFQLCRTNIEIEAATQIGQYGPLRAFRDDMILEGQIGLAHAAEYYRPDQNCSFPSFASMIIHRRIVQTARKYRTSMSEGGSAILQGSFDADENMSFTNLIPTKDKLSDPVFRLHFNEAKDRLEEAEQKMNEGERRILHSWIEGGTYAMRCGKLGLTYRQYEGRLGRVKKKMIAAVKDEPVLKTRTGNAAV